MPVERLAGLGIIPSLDAQASAFQMRAASLRSSTQERNRGAQRGPIRGQQGSFQSDELLELLQSGQPSSFTTIGIDDPNAPGSKLFFRGNVETGTFEPFQQARITEGPSALDPSGAAQPPLPPDLRPDEFGAGLLAREGEPGRDFPSASGATIRGVAPEISPEIEAQVRQQLAELRAKRTAQLPILPEEDREFIEFGVRSGAIRNPAELFRALGNVRAGERQRRLRDTGPAAEAKAERAETKFERDLARATEKVANALGKLAAGPGTSRTKARQARELIGRQEPRFRERLTTTFGTQLELAEEAPLAPEELLGITTGRSPKRLITQNEQNARQNFVEILEQAEVNPIELMLAAEASLREDLRRGQGLSVVDLRDLVRRAKDPQESITAFEGTVFPRDVIELLDQVEAAHEANANAQVPDAGAQARRLVQVQMLELLLTSLRQQPQKATDTGLRFGRPTRQIERGAPAGGADLPGTRRAGEVEALQAEGGSPVLKALLEAIESPGVQRRRRARRLGQ